MLLQTILHKALAHTKDFQHRFRGIPEFMSRTFSVRRKITGIPALTLSVLTILSASCSDLTFYTESGSQPDKSAIDAAPVIYLRAEQTPEDKVNITMDYGEGSATVDIYAVSDKPLDFSQPLRLAFGSEKFVADYSDSTGIEYTLLPAAFYSFADGNSLEIGTGETSAAKNTLTVWSKTLFGAELEKGRYLLPLEATSTLYEVRDSLVLIDVTIREQYTDPDGYELWDKLFTVFYLNTAVFDPRLANDMVAEYGWRGYVDGVYTSYTENYAMGHIVNLRSSMLSYDEATGRVGIEPSTDMRYVLNHYDKYVRPVQDSGRKVLLCITGGGKGVGFCNLTDIQIDQFVSAVRRLVDIYGLDGINLWDRDSGYDIAEEKDLPSVNTTSYPKLIKAVKETLGADKLVTVTDYEEPTEYFHDVEAMGGIEVGKYIDYAWSGYCDNTEDFQVIDPWHQNMSPVSELYPRQPIAGLPKERYGCINVPCYTEYKDGDMITEWVRKGYNPNNIFVFYDIRSNMQDQYEGGQTHPAAFLDFWFYNDENGYYQGNLARFRPHTDHTGYNAWVKDW